MGTGTARNTDIGASTKNGTGNDVGASRSPRNNRDAENHGTGKHDTGKHDTGKHDAENQRVMTMVWWIYPPDDEYQHATTRRPPHDGGSVRTLCQSTVDVEDRANVSLNPHRPHCPECVGSYLSTPEPFPVWSY